MPEPARAQGDEARHEYRIEAGPLGRALNQLATQSRIQLLYEPELVADLTVPSVVGTLTVPEALSALLQGSGLVAHHVSGDTIVLRPNPPRGESAQTGTIRGTVTLPDGSPASGVQVTATSPALVNQKTTYTDKMGRYTLSDLTPARYALTFEMEGMAPKEGDKTTTVSPGEEIQLDVSLVHSRGIREIPRSSAVVGWGGQHPLLASRVLVAPVLFEGTVDPVGNSKDFALAIRIEA